MTWETEDVVVDRLLGRLGACATITRPSVRRAGGLTDLARAALQRLDSMSDFEFREVLEARQLVAVVAARGTAWRQAGVDARADSGGDS